MSLADMFKKRNTGTSYDAAAEFFVTPELIIQEGKQDGYSLAIDTGYEDLTRTVKRLSLDGDEVSIKTETSYVDFQELYTSMGITGAPKDVVCLNTSSSGITANTTKVDAVKDKAKETKSKSTKTTTTVSPKPLPVEGVMLASALPEKITLKQTDVIEQGVYYKPIKVISTLEVHDDGVKTETPIATSYYLAPVSYIDGVYKELSAAQCSHIVETSWSDAYIEAMNGDSGQAQTSVAPVSRVSSGAKSALKAPVIVALSIATALGSLYTYNNYQQNNNPLSLAASNGNVGSYMSAKGTNTDEYTQRQLEATKAALSSMGIDVSAEADIGCLIE